MKKTLISKELAHHTPFTFLAATLAILLVIIISNTTTLAHSESTFKFFHFSHIFVSAIATTAIYYKYKKSIPKAILIGTIGTLLIGTLSDVIFPFIGASIFFFSPELHIPLINKPLLIISIAILGTLTGILTQKSELPHLLHVSISVFASLFYIIAYAHPTNIIHWLISLIIVFVAVILPCCLSDIVFPLIFIKNKSLKKSIHQKHNKK